MPRRQDQRDQALDAITAHLRATGLSRTSLRQLAAAAGISDRMLLYYFKDKSDVLSAALDRIASTMAADLDTALAPDRKLSARDLIAQASLLTRSDDFRPYMRLGLEISAAAARREAPYVEISHAISMGFLAWIEERLDIADHRTRRRMASLILVLVDGMAVFDAGEAREIADDACAALSDLNGLP